MKQLTALSFVLILCQILECKARAQTEVAIALIKPLTGSDSASTQGDLLQRGAEIAIFAYRRELIKAGIHLRLIQIEYKDGVDQILKSSQTAIKSEAQVAFGYTFSDHVLLIYDQFIKNKMPLITPDATATRIGRIRSFVHSTAASNNYQAHALVSLAKKRTKNGNALIIESDDCSYCVDLSAAIKDALSESKGFKSIKTLKISSNKENQLIFKNYLSNLMPKPDTVFLPNYEIPSANLLKLVLENFHGANIYGGDGWSMFGGQVLRKQVAEDTSAFAVAHWDVNATGKKQVFFLSQTSDISEESKASAAMAFDGMAILIQSLLRCRKLDRQSIERCLVEKKDYQSLTGVTIFSVDGPQKSLALKKVSQKGFHFIKWIGPPMKGAKP